MTAAVFAYPFLTFNVVARVADALELEVNRRSWRVPIDAVRFFYVVSNGRHQTLLVAHELPDGRRDILRTSANAGAPQFQALVDHLVALKPGADLRGRPRREAFKTMGARDVEQAVRRVVPVAIVLLVFGLMTPYIIQGFDEGSQRLEAGELATAQLTTSNLLLSGTLDTQRFLYFTTGRGVSEPFEPDADDLWAKCREAVLERKRRLHSYYLFAVQPAGAPADAAVPVVLRVPDLGEEGIAGVKALTTWKCTLRELLWQEGLSASERAALRDQAHLNVTANTKLCELDAGLGVPVWGLLGLLACTAAFICGLLALSRRTQRAFREAGAQRSSGS